MKITKGKAVDGPEVTRRNLLDTQVCVPKQWTDEQVLEFAEKENPCGASTGWAIRKAGNKHLGGDPERNRCDADDSYVHIRLDALSEWEPQ